MRILQFLSRSIERNEPSGWLVNPSVYSVTSSLRISLCSDVRRSMRSIRTTRCYRKGSSTIKLIARWRACARMHRQENSRFVRDRCNLRFGFSQDARLTEKRTLSMIASCFGFGHRTPTHSSRRVAEGLRYGDTEASLPTTRIQEPIGRFVDRTKDLVPKKRSICRRIGAYLWHSGSENYADHESRTRFQRTAHNGIPNQRANSDS